MVHPHWPLFDVEVRTPRLTLRYVDDELGAEIVDVAAAGVHDPGFMPFVTPWTDAAPDELGPNSFRYWWQARATTGPATWNFDLAVIEDGRVVGAAGLRARGFPTLRWFETGSWLGLAHQGRGLGTEVRVAALHLGFVGLDAEVAATEAFADNGPSLAVTCALGYEPNGIEHVARRGELGVVHRFRMDRAHFEAHVRRDDVVVAGDEGARALLGIPREA